MENRLLALKLFKSSSDAISSVGERTEIDYAELAVSIFLKFIDVLEGVAVIIIGLFIVRYVKRYFAKIETTHENQRTAFNLLEKITSGFIVVISITVGLKIIGIDLTLIISVLTLGLSFGLRDVIKNYVAGLLILFKSPFEIGDIVKIRSFTGKVVKIDFQAITITTFDQKEITVHNKDILTQPITNFSKNPTRRLEINLRLGYGSDMSRAIKIIERILGNEARVLKTPKHSIHFNAFSDTGVGLVVRFWVQRPCNILKIRTDLALQIEEALDEESLLAPYNREAGLAGEYGMTALRKERLKTFYGQPILADIAGQTVLQVAAVSNGAAVAAVVPVEEYIDADEPE